MRFGAVFRIRECYGAVRCGFRMSWTLRCGSVTFDVLRCGSVRFSNIVKATVRCGSVLQRAKILRCGSVRSTAPNRDEPHRTDRKKRTVKNPAKYVEGNILSALKVERKKWQEKKWTEGRVRGGLRMYYLQVFHQIPNNHFQLEFAADYGYWTASRVLRTYNPNNIRQLYVSTANHDTKERCWFTRRLMFSRQCSYVSSWRIKTSTLSPLSPLINGIVAMFAHSRKNNSQINIKNQLRNTALSTSMLPLTTNIRY